MAGGFESFTYTSDDGLKLHARLYGQQQQSRLPVVCLPGLTRNARDFHRLAEFLSTDESHPRQIIAFDYRGRGQSDRDPEWKNYAIGRELQDVMQGLSALRCDRAHFIGTSRGGLILHIMAVVRPQLIASVVLNDIGPVIEAEGLNFIRRYLNGTPKPLSRTEALDLQRSVHGAAFPAFEEADWSNMVDALYRADETGSLLPDFDPSLMNTLQTQTPEAPLPQLWKEFDALATKPVMIIRGSNSTLLSEVTVEDMVRRGRSVETVTVMGQGHAPDLATCTLPEQILDFLNRADGDEA